jgi:hypothetical protein
MESLVTISTFQHSTITKMDVAICFGVLESTRHEQSQDDEIKSIFSIYDRKIEWNCHNFVDPQILSKIICFTIPSHSSLWTQSKKFTPSIRFNRSDKFSSVRFWANNEEAFKAHIDELTKQ